jgi:hypothetical protein
MTRVEFSTFVEASLQSAMRLAEEYSGRSLPSRFAFQWLGQALIRENIVEVIVSRVFVDENHIYPCVDIGVGDLLDDGTPVIVALVAGYAPKPFGKNWQGKEGPFIQLSKLSGNRFSTRYKAYRWGEINCLAFITPGMKNLKDQ